MPTNFVGPISLDAHNVRAGSQTGIDGRAQVGDTVIYDNVGFLESGEPIAVVVRVTALSHPGLTVDLTDPGQNGVFRVNANGDKSMDGETVSLSFDFINQNTGLAIVISGSTTVNDIDGNANRPERVIIDTNEFTSYGTDVDTELLTDLSGDHFTVTGTEGNSPNDQDAWFQMNFEDQSQINMSFGATSGRSFYGFTDNTLSNPTFGGAPSTPVIGGDVAGAVGEAGHLDDGTPVPGVLSAFGVMTATDEDPGATATWSGSTEGTYGTFVVDAETGAWGFSLANERPETEALAEGQIVTETFTVTVTDDHGLSSSQDITITVSGTNDAPVVTTSAGEDQGTVSEAGQFDDGTPTTGVPQASGTLTSSDVDAGATATWSSGLGGTYGALDLDPTTGEWTYTLDNSLPTTNALAEGQTVTETFEVLVTDEFGATAPEVVTITINGTNDAPIITSAAGENTGTVSEDGHEGNCDPIEGDATATGTLSATDVDEGATTTWSGDSVGTYGTFAIDPETGEWAYTLDNDLESTQALAFGDHAFETFTVVVTDEFGASASQEVTIRIDGRDDGECDNTVVTEDIWLAGVACDAEANQLIETQWKYHGGSGKLELSIEIPIEAFFGEDSPYIFESIETQPYIDAFAELGITIDPSDFDVEVTEDSIDIKITGRDVDLDPTEVAALPMEFETDIGVSIDGMAKVLKACMGIDETKVYSPIALDLNNSDAIEVTGNSTAQDRVDDAVNATVYFDIDADGTLDRIEWLDGTGDGFLVDNRDGKAATEMDGARLFGDQGGTYANGYEKLSLLDTNSDGQLTGEELQGLEIWVDDGDAIVEEGELQSLAENGITSISVQAREVINEKGEVLLQGEAVVAEDPIPQISLPSAVDTYQRNWEGDEGDTTLGTDRDDRLRGGKKEDKIVGGAGEDRIDGGKGNDILLGEAGGDRINGGKGEDLLLGGLGQDALNGGSGNDILAGQGGDDTLTGGKGEDTFVVSAGSGHDRVTDFTIGEDRLEIGSPFNREDLEVTKSSGEIYTVTWGTDDSITLNIKGDPENVTVDALLIGHTDGYGMAPAPTPIVVASPAADLVLANATSNIAAARDSEEIVFNYDVINQGTADTSSKTKFYYSEDDIFDEADILLEAENNGKMRVGEMRSEETSIDVEDLSELADSGYIFAVIEGTSDVFEFNEANNIAAFEFDLL